MDMKTEPLWESLYSRTFSIYQLKRGDEFRGIRFEPLYRLEAQGRTVSAANYQRVYEGPFEDGLTLENIYSRFNTPRPKDFYGHSLSVSDVVVLKRGGEEKTFYCDSVGFSELPRFQAVRSGADITGAAEKAG